MLNTNDAGTESRSLRGLERMMSVIVTACSAFGLTVSEANTEMVRLKTTGWRKMSVTLNAAGQVYKQTIEDRFYDSPPPPPPPPKPAIMFNERFMAARHEERCY